MEVRGVRAFLFTPTRRGIAAGASRLTREFDLRSDATDTAGLDSHATTRPNYQWSLWSSILIQSFQAELSICSLHSRPHSGQA